MEQQLSEKDKKTLHVFSMYLQSYGSKVGKYTIQVSTEYEVYFEEEHWTGDSTRMWIDSYDAIDNLIKKIFHENEDAIMGKFSDEDRGYIVAIVNCNDRTLKFKVEVYQMDVEYTRDEYEFADISNERVRKWIEEIGTTHVSGEINYEGSGDSGYIEEDIVFDDNTRGKYPDFLEKWLYDQLSQFGGWEINEGSQGHFHFNFREKTMSLSHGSNYESEKVYEIPLSFGF